MTQFILCKQNGAACSRCNIEWISIEEDSFLSEVASYVFPNTDDKNIFTLVFDGESFDSICTAAQRDMAEGKSFAETNLFSCMKSLLESCNEFVLWYAREYDDLDYVYDGESLLQKIEESLVDSSCEMYLRYSCHG